MRRLLLLAVFAAGLLILPGARGGAALAQVQVVIPWPAGGGTDIIGRLIQPVMGEVLGQQVVIRNLGGGVGTIGTAEVVRARPDGQTLLLTSPNPIALMPSYRPSLPYRAEQGGFRWSSQRPEGGGCDGHSAAAIGSGPAGRDPLAWRAGRGTA